MLKKTPVHVMPQYAASCYFIEQLRWISATDTARSEHLFKKSLEETK